MVLAFPLAPGEFCFPLEEADFPGQHSSVCDLDHSFVALLAVPSGLAPLWLRPPNFLTSFP